MSTLARILRTGTVALIASLMLSPLAMMSVPTSAYAQSMSAKEFVQKLGDDAIKQLTDKTVPNNERVKRMRALLRSSFNEPAVAKMVLGPAFKTTSNDQFKEFQRLYEIVVAHNYAGLFKRYSGETFTVKSEQPQNETTMKVIAQINQTNGGPPIPVELQIDKDDSSWKATDIKVDGVSMPQTHRKEYASVINRSSNGVEGLLEALRTKAKQLEADEPSE